MMSSPAFTLILHRGFELLVLMSQCFISSLAEVNEELTERVLGLSVSRCWGAHAHLRTTTSP